MLDPSTSSPVRPSPAPPADEQKRTCVLDSRELFAHCRQVPIRHGSDTYVLRLTRQGKLILTK